MTHRELRGYAPSGCRCTCSFPVMAVAFGLWSGGVWPSHCAPLDSNGGGRLVASGHQGEAERLALLAPQLHVLIESTAQSTWENVERSIPYFEEADRLAIASGSFHARCPPFPGLRALPSTM